MTKSNLVIQVPFKSQAEELKREFDRRSSTNWINKVKIIHGSLSDTYGVAIDFDFWFKAPFAFCHVILDGNIYKKITGGSWEEGRYLEVWHNNYGQPEALEISYTELLTKEGKYYIDDVYYYRGKVYISNYEFDNLLMTSSDISLMTGRENLKITPGMITGIEKLWRRGFLYFPESDLHILQGYYESTKEI